MFLIGSSPNIYIIFICNLTFSLVTISVTCQHNIQYAITSMKLANVNVQLTSMILRISNTGRYSSMLYHCALVCLSHSFQHAWFHGA